MYTYHGDPQNFKLIQNVRVQGPVAPNSQPRQVTKTNSRVQGECGSGHGPLPPEKKFHLLVGVMLKRGVHSQLLDICWETLVRYLLFLLFVSALEDVAHLNSVAMPK